MKTIVIYHKADYDGIFCREIARKFLPDAKLIGWDYGDQVPAIETGTQLYMLDISVEGLMGIAGLIWIDHHKSAIEKYPSTIAGYRIDGVAACRLAWQWFTDKDAEQYRGRSWSGGCLSAFVDRTVKEPLAVRLAGEYDVWDKRDPDADTFQYGLRTMDEPDWNLLLSNDVMTQNLIHLGHIAQQYGRYCDKISILSRGFDLDWEGLHFLACNAARYNSQLFEAGIKPEHDALLGFGWNGKLWTVSLYHAPGKEHHDLSLIAVKYGGGGHRGACGFRADKLPWIP